MTTRPSDRAMHDFWKAQLAGDRSADLWDGFGTRLPSALHRAGRFEEGLREAANRRRRKHLLLAAIGDEARAMAALGRLVEVDRLMLEVATLPADGPRTAGHVMFNAAQELRAHGHDQEAASLFRRAVTRARTRAPTASTNSNTAALLARCCSRAVTTRRQIPFTARGSVRIPAV